jgi:hypothetical protein
MPYEGEIIYSCDARLFRFDELSVVVVSGAKWNPCGHSLLNFGGPTGLYCHVAGLRGYPRYMEPEDYARYLAENGKKELYRQRVQLPNPQAAQLFLERLLSDKWTWFMLPHNCVGFVEDVVAAGGGEFSLMSNCPATIIPSQPAPVDWGAMRRKRWDLL